MSRFTSHRPRSRHAHSGTRGRIAGGLSGWLVRTGFPVANPRGQRFQVHAIHLPRKSDSNRIHASAARGVAGMASYPLPAEGRWPVPSFIPARLRTTIQQRARSRQDLNRTDDEDQPQRGVQRA